VYAAPDDHQARLVINHACVKLGRECIFVGFGTRARAGQVLWYRPGESMCFQCFLKSFPELIEDVEIANQAHADRVAYSDKIVPVEPGLVTDIAPVTTMAVKLGIQSLLKGQETTLRSLDEDFTAPLYLWANRREGNFESLDLLSDTLNGMSILRWYGINVPADPDCPVCGNSPRSEIDDAD